MSNPSNDRKVRRKTFEKYWDDLKNCNSDMQIEMGGGTAEHFPDDFNLTILCKPNAMFDIPERNLSFGMCTAWWVVPSHMSSGVWIQSYLKSEGRQIMYILYRAYQMLVDWVLLTWISSVTLSARLCLDWWEFGRSGWARWWSTEINVNPTQDSADLVHPVQGLVQLNFTIQVK